MTGHSFPVSGKKLELIEVTMDFSIQFRTSRTDHFSATNHEICQFVTIRRNRGRSLIRPLIDFDLRVRNVTCMC